VGKFDDDGIQFCDIQVPMDNGNRTSNGKPPAITACLRKH